MAKKREVAISNMKVVGDGVELAARITFGLSMFKGDPSVEHVMSINFSMKLTQLVMLAIKSIVIDAQKYMRDTLQTHAKVREWTGRELGYTDVYPGVRAARVSVARDMTPDEIRVKCKTDKAFRTALMAELAEMEDEDVALAAS
jgi:hypothetical protein